MDDRAHWLKVQYPDDRLFTVGQVVPTKSGSWCLFCDTPPRLTARRASPKPLDTSVIRYLLTLDPVIDKVVVHQKGAGRVYVLPRQTLESVRDRNEFRHKNGRRSTARDFVAIPAEKWVLREVAEPFPIPTTPFDRSVILCDNAK